MSDLHSSAGNSWRCSAASTPESCSACLGAEAVLGFSQQGTRNPSLPLRFDVHPSAVLRTGCVWQVRNIPSLPASRAGVTSAALEEGEGNVLMALCGEG